MILGLGVSDAAYSLELQHKYFYVAHELASFREESFTTEKVGAEAKFSVLPKSSLILRSDLGYEHHYKSTYYAQSYAVFTPSVGVRSNHDYLGLQILWSPMKGFLRLNRQKDYAEKGFRVQPNITLSIRLDLLFTTYVPRALLQDKTPPSKGKKQ